LEKVISALDIAAVSETVRNLTPRAGPFFSNECKEFLFVLRQPLVLGNARVETTDPPLRALRASAVVSDECCDLAPVVQTETMDASEQTCVLERGPRAGLPAHAHDGIGHHKARERRRWTIGDVKDAVDALKRLNCSEVELQQITDCGMGTGASEELLKRITDELEYRLVEV
jgi:hypothetical protein